MYVAFIYYLCLFVLGTVVPESFVGDFMEQEFDESQFLFEDQQAPPPPPPHQSHLAEFL
jgi:hypothetical protein